MADFVKSHYIIISPSFSKILSGGIYANVGKREPNGDRVSGYYQISFRKKDETNDFNYFTLRDIDGKYKVTYWPDVVGQPISEHNGWMAKGRKVMTVENFVSKYIDTTVIVDKTEYIDFETHTPKLIDTELVGKEVTNSELKTKIIQRACELIIEKGKADDISLKPKVVKAGNGAIKNVYWTQQAESTGHLLGSCMRPNSDYDCKKFGAFYDLIPNLFIVYDTNDDGELIYRALLWTLDDGSRYLDRPYGNEKHEQALIDWGIQQGFRVRLYNAKNPTDMKVTLSDEAINYLKNFGCPYLDSFEFLTGNVLYNVLHDSYDCDYFFRELSGSRGYKMKLRFRCPKCNHTFNEEYRMKTPQGDMCTDCVEGLFDRCERCGKYEEKDGLNNCGGDFYCDYCAERSGYTECAICKKWTKGQHYVEAEDIWVCDGCIGDHYVKCDDCLDWIKR